MKNIFRLKLKFVLLGITIIAALLRFWQIGNVPISPDWDEVSLGYNAYSILLTGKDEYGKFLPVLLRSYNDYKPALYAYLAIPFIKLFGLSVFSIRLPSVLFGIAAVLGTYFLVFELLGNRKVALLASFLLAISPWHLQFSRVAFEASIGMGINVFVILFFLKGLKKVKYIFLSTALMGINLYSYQSEKVFVPLMFIVLILLFRNKISLTRKNTLVILEIGFIVLLPMIVVLITDRQSLSRAYGVSFLSEKTLLLSNDVQKIERDTKNNDTLGLLLDNRRIEYAKTIAFGYLTHFDLNWLFIKGDSTIDRHHAPWMGLLYITELPFLLIGIYSLFVGNLNKKIKSLLLLWFLVTPIPAMVTTGVPHSVRTLNFLPTFQIFTALGIFKTLDLINEKLKRKWQKLVLISLSILLFVFNFVYYLDQYFVQQNYYYAKSWQHGYKEIVDYLKPRHLQYKKVIVSNTADMNQSYMFFLFYLQFDPSDYQKNGNENKFSNFEFRKLNSNEEKNTLLVGSGSDLAEKNEMYRINYPDKTTAMRIIEVK